MHALKPVVPAIICLFAFFGLASADTLYLKNGRSIEGIIKSEEGEFVALDVCGGSVKFKTSEIDRIDRSSLQEQGAIQEKWQAQKKDWENRVITRQREEESKPRAVDFKEPSSPKNIEISQDRSSIVLDVTLNKKVKASLILDTGASVIMLKKDFAKKLGIDLNELGHNMKVVLADGRTANARHIVLDSVQVQNVEAQNVEATILLDEQVRDNELEFERPASTSIGDGLLGMSFLKHFNFKIDQKQKKLILEKL